jgi:hypothetical protein
MKQEVASWPTPTRQDAASSGAAGYSTESGRHSGTTLTDAAGWVTPTNRDYRFANAKTYQDRGGGKKGEQLNNQVVHLVSGMLSSGSHAQTEKRGQLSPDHSRWLMGYSAAHLSCAPTAMPSSRK